MIGMCCLGITANAQTATDIQAMETCLAESVMVAEPDHCIGLFSDACIAKGGAPLDCLDHEESVWHAILRNHGPHRTETSDDGVSQHQEARTPEAACAATPMSAKRCLMQESARKAAQVFLGE